MAEINEIRTQLRLPSDLHERINEAAKASGRSMNAEIVQRLAFTFPEKYEEELLERRYAELVELEHRAGEANLLASFSLENLKQSEPGSDSHNAQQEELRLQQTRLQLLTSLADSVRLDIARLTSARREFDRP